MTKRAITPLALLLAALIWAPEASAHGANPAVLDGGVRTNDDTPWLVRLSRGLGRATTDGVWEYLCPQQFRADETVFVARLATDRALVIGLTGAYVVPQIGDPVPAGDLPFSSGELRSVSRSVDGEALVLATEGEGTALWRFDPEPTQVDLLDEPWRIVFFDGTEAWLARVDGTTVRWRSADGTREGSAEVDDASAGSGLAIRVLPDGWHLGVQVSDGVRIGRVAPTGEDGESVPADWFGTLSPAFGGPTWHDDEPLWLDSDRSYRLADGALADAGETPFVEYGGGLGEAAWGVSVRQLVTLDTSGVAGSTLFDLTDLQAWPLPEGANELTQQQCYLDALDVAFHAGLAGPDQRLQPFADLAFATFSAISSTFMAPRKRFQVDSTPPKRIT